MEQQDVIGRLKEWAEITDSVNALVLTSSRAAFSTAPTDHFSDYDVAVYVSSLDEYQNDTWLSFFGDVLVKWPNSPRTTFDNSWLTRLVIFENRVRIDFQITTNPHRPPTDFDLGYQVLVDKTGITQTFPAATQSEHLIKQPSEEEFLEIINDFFWDATYVTKYLWRKDLFYSKFMLDSSLRFNYFEKMIEWHIGSQNNWSVKTNVHGRYFPKYLDQQTWAEIKETFAGSDIKENWTAFFKMTELFIRFAKQLAEQLGFQYPDKQEEKMLAYFKESKTIQN